MSELGELISSTLDIRKPKLRSAQVAQLVKSPTLSFSSATHHICFLKEGVWLPLQGGKFTVSTPPTAPPGAAAGLIQCLACMVRTGSSSLAVGGIRCVVRKLLGPARS